MIKGIILRIQDLSRRLEGLFLPEDLKRKYLEEIEELKQKRESYERIINEGKLD